MKSMPMPKTRKDYEHDLLCAFKMGMVNGYGIDHEDIHNSEDAAIMDFVKINRLKTDVYKKFIYSENHGIETVKITE